MLSHLKTVEQSIAANEDTFTLLTATSKTAPQMGDVGEARIALYGPNPGQVRFVTLSDLVSVATIGELS